ncbi:MAG: hypothetical protein HYR73_00480 [Candidatus Eisenbacteria bacterium]|nr:hypothetical protein [Candidatus Eisenbacteria bacterium]
MERRHGLALGVLGALIIAVVVARPTRHVPPPSPSRAQVAAPGVAASTFAPSHREIGFHSRERLVEHFEKHGREFGAIDMNAYLRLAQTLRDRPAGGDVLETTRADGAITRFDRASGAFLSFDPDLHIRTFFKPNDGENYFRRQAMRGH